MSIGIALSGGGARGFAHAGVLKALDEMQIRVSMISGTSSGAVIGAFYAAGLRPSEIVKIVQSVELFRVLDISIFRPGLFKTDAVKESLNKHLSGLRFEDLKIPLTVASTDFQNSEPFYFSSGNLVDGLLASSAIAGMYRPVELNGRWYVDGGLLDNFPVAPLISRCSVLIGVNVNPVNSIPVHEFSIGEMLDRSFHIALSPAVREKSRLCTVFLEPPELGRFGMFDIDDAEEIAAIGYRYTMKFKSELLNLAEESKLNRIENQRKA